MTGPVSEGHPEPPKSEKVKYIYDIFRYPQFGFEISSFFCKLLENSLTSGIYLEFQDIPTNLFFRSVD